MKRTSILLSLALASACGKVSSLVDGGNGSGTDFDANTGPDANTRGTVKVTVMDPSGTGAPATGIAVVFLDPDGTMVANAPSGIDGKAQADVLPGGSVTAVFATSATSYSMDTIMGVKPGDDLVIAERQNSSPKGTFTVTFPALASATFYYVYGPCGDAFTQSTSAQLTMYAYCATSPMTISVIGYTSAGYSGYLEKGNVAFLDGGSTAINGPWPTLSSMSGTINNIPAQVTSAYVSRYAPDRAGYPVSISSGALANGTLTLSGSVGTASAALIQTSVSTDQNMQQDFLQPVAGNATTYNFNVGDHLMPWISYPVLDPATGKVTLPISGTDTGTSDAFEAMVTYSRVAGTTTTRFVWTVMAGAPGDFTLPVLPTSVGDVYPKAGDALDKYGRISVMYDADTVPSYDAIRNSAFRVFSPCGDYEVPAPTDAKLVRVSHTTTPC